MRSKVMIDRRCPTCDRPVRGREDVVHVQDTRVDRAITRCPHCARVVQLVASDPVVDLTDFYFSH